MNDFLDVYEKTSVLSSYGMLNTYTYSGCEKRHFVRDLLSTTAFSIIIVNQKSVALHHVSKIYPFVWNKELKRCGTFSALSFLFFILFYFLVTLHHRNCAVSLAFLSVKICQQKNWPKECPLRSGVSSTESDVEKPCVK